MTNHFYGKYRGSIAKCTYCGVRRRWFRDRAGRRRSALGKPTGKYQYQAPCQSGRDSWQWKKLPCLENK